MTFEEAATWLGADRVESTADGDLWVVRGTKRLVIKAAASYCDGEVWVYLGDVEDMA